MWAPLFVVSFMLSMTLCAKQQKSPPQITIAQEGKKEQKPTRKQKKQDKKSCHVKKSEVESAVKLAQADDQKGEKREKKKGHPTGIRSKSVNKTLSSMNFQELKQSKELLVAAGNKDVAIKYLEKMIPQCTDMHDLAEIMIELGNLYYDTGRLAKAFTMYREFVNLYPGSDHVEYALYRAVVCKFDGISDAERDQTPTKETIELAEEFLERSDLFVTCKDKVEEILKKCRERLFENEMTVFNFYLFNKRFIAANKRLDSIKKEFIKLEPELEPRIMLLDIELAQAQNNNELVEQKQSELITKFPDYVIQTAQNIPKKKSWLERF